MIYLIQIIWKYNGIIYWSCIATVYLLPLLTLQRGKRKPKQLQMLRNKNYDDDQCYVEKIESN